MNQQFEASTRAFLVAVIADACWTARQRGRDDNGRDDVADEYLPPEAWWAVEALERAYFRGDWGTNEG